MPWKTTFSRQQFIQTMIHSKVCRFVNAPYQKWKTNCIWICQRIKRYKYANMWENRKILSKRCLHFLQKYLSLAWVLKPNRISSNVTTVSIDIRKKKKIKREGNKKKWQKWWVNHMWVIEDWLKGKNSPSKSFINKLLTNPFATTDGKVLNKASNAFDPLQWL